MDRPGHCRKFARIAFAVLLLASAGAQARRVEAEVARMEFALGRVDALRLRIDAGARDAAAKLQLDAGALDGGALGYRFRDLRWRCDLVRESSGAYACVGPLRARGQGSATLRARWSDAGVEIELRGATGALAAHLPSDASVATRLDAETLPLAWLQPLLAAAWKDGRVTAGTLSGELSLRARETGGMRLDGPLKLDALGLDSSDGRIGVAGLDAESQLALDLGPRDTAIDLQLALHGGELLAGPVYTALPSTPVRVALAAASVGEGDWNASRLEWNDPGVLELAGSARLDLRATPSLRDLELQARSADLSRAHARYLDTPLSTAGLPGLQLAGGLASQVSMSDATLTGWRIDASSLQVRDGGGRFSLQELDGDLRWTAGATPQSSRLRWSGAELYRIAFGAAELPLRSTARRIELAEAVALPLLQGTLQLSRFAWEPSRAADRGANLDVALELSKLDLAALSRALDWPPFAGSLSGRIPAVRYADEVLDLEGGLQVDVFDGRVTLDALTLERPFGVAPTLAADIAMKGLDLKPLTGAFGFGEITGRLDGHVRGLRLVDWLPVAFDADLHTAGGGRESRRISRRAVDDLSRVGGAGLVAGLQTQVLKLFDTFGYARIGLKCRLANDVCHMDGLDASGNGYTIVEGSGLPRITVIGHQRQVDWQVLVARLKAATEGQAPIVD